MATLLKALIDASPAKAHEPALTDDAGVTSWGELDGRVNRLINHLRSLPEVQPGERIALLSGNRREVYEVILAAAHMGVLVVPINWHLAPDEVEYVVGVGHRRARLRRQRRHGAGAHHRVRRRL
jgi:long-chain acyl-CoA synthetase